LRLLVTYILQHRVDHAAPRARPLLARRFGTWTAEAEAAFRRAAAFGSRVLHKCLVDDKAVSGEGHPAVSENDAQ
jgi:hypothetical protein